MISSPGANPWTRSFKFAWASSIVIVIYIDRILDSVGAESIGSTKINQGHRLRIHAGRNALMPDQALLQLNRIGDECMLAGKTALVTGSTSGIGLGIAIAMARQGAKVVLNGFGDIEGAKMKLREFTDAVEYHPADMSKPDEIAAMIQEAESQWGGVDILVNNAGIQYVCPIETFSTERWDALIAVNLSAAFHTMRCALASISFDAGQRTSRSPI